MNTHELADRVIATMRSYGHCLIAFSGGVDSAVVAKAARLALGEKAIAITAVSPSLAAGELEQAQELAQLIGIEHRQMATSEVTQAAYRRNGPDRCYHCKTELYDHLAAIAAAYPEAVLVNGTNADDLGDYRPGLQAADEHDVRSPLAECGASKQDVRALAAHFQLPVWNKPAMPCLSSRIAYGVEVTPDRLRMVDQAEQFLRQHGLEQVRVRYHGGDMARLEVPVADIAKLVSDPLRSELCEHFRSIGFQFMTLDLEGFRSGSLNTLVPLETLRASAPHGGA